MFPRKRQRPNPATASTYSLPTTALSPETSLSQATSASEPGGADQQAASRATTNGTAKLPPHIQKGKTVRKSQSWYGSWPRAAKASPSTSIARETIFVGTAQSREQSEASETAQSDPNSTDEPKPISITKEPTLAPPKISESGLTLVGSNASKPEVAMGQGIPSTDEDSKMGSTKEEPAAQQAAGSGWLGWWYKTPNDKAPAGHSLEPVPEAAQSESDEDQEHSDGKEDGSNEINKSTQEATEEATEEHQQQEHSATATEDVTSSAVPQTSWFSYLPSIPGYRAKQPVTEDVEDAGQSSPKEPEVVETSLQPAPPDSSIVAAQPTDTTLRKSNSKKATKLPVEDSTEPQQAKPTEDPKPESKPQDSKDTDQPKTPKAGSTWAFWSRDAPKSKSKPESNESGEIAVIGEGSEVQPQPITQSEVTDTPAKENKGESASKDAQAATKSMWRRSKRVRPVSMDLDSSRPSSSDSTKPNLTARSPVVPAAETAIQPPTKVETPKKSAEAEAAVAAAKLKPNLLLPSFESTYRMKENPSILRQVTSLVSRSTQSPPNHVFRVKDHLRVRKAIAIGVHGFFPATYLRPMIGQPTGTSLRFAGLAADAIRRWTDAHGSRNCEIEKIALEGEGRINERVDNLWKLLLNWVDQIRRADLIILACHSQGVPVSIMLLQKMIDLGIITHTRVGVCAMAGVALGPFPDYKSSILMGSAAELWDFGNPQSNNSRRFELSLRRVLDYGARVTFIGSIDDQLVPMESAVYSPAQHPYIYRAVFIDGRIHAADFISHLVGFALKLRNLGVSDHGLVKELSVALAGSLYSGEGHSRLYFDDAVYDLAVMHALETSNTAQPTTCVIPTRDSTELASSNPYVLPWIMRGLLEENYVKTQLSAETEDLLRQFDDWKPTNKALKDVKYRLEAVRSKL